MILGVPEKELNGPARSWLSLLHPEDRDRFKQLLHKIDLAQPENGISRSTEEACEIANRIGYPVVIRPSYVLGGRAMEIAYSEEFLRKYIKHAANVNEDGSDNPEGRAQNRRTEMRVR